MRDAVDAEDVALAIPVDAFRDQVGLRARCVRRHAFERHWRAAFKHGLVVLHETLCGLFGIKLEVVTAYDLVGGAANETRCGPIGQDVTALEVLDEDGVRRRVDDRQQDVGCVRDRLHGAKAS
jgi:hypothetical protein